LRAGDGAAYHKQTRQVPGILNPAVNDLIKTWHRTLSVPQRIRIADAL